MFSDGCGNHAGFLQFLARMTAPLATPQVPTPKPTLLPHITEHFVLCLEALSLTIPIYKFQHLKYKYMPLYSTIFFMTITFPLFFSIKPENVKTEQLHRNLESICLIPSDRNASHIGYFEEVTIFIVNKKIQKCTGHITINLRFNIYFWVQY